MFNQCSRLTALVMPASVKVIDGFITMSSGVTSIEFENPINWLRLYDAYTSTSVSISNFSEDGSSNYTVFNYPYYTYFEKLD